MAYLAVTALLFSGLKERFYIFEFFSRRCSLISRDRRAFGTLYSGSGLRLSFHAGPCSASRSDSAPRTRSSVDPSYLEGRDRRGISLGVSFIRKNPSVSSWAPFLKELSLLFCFSGSRKMPFRKKPA